MKIGIDARPLVGHKSGIGHYLEQILLVWAGMQESHEFYLFAHKDFVMPPELDQMKKVVMGGRPGTLWMQYAVPYLLHRNQIDLFWGPNYSIPLIRPERTKAVITIHDMVSYVYPETLPGKTVLHNRYGLPMYVRKSDRVITESQSTKNDIVQFLGLAPSDIEIALLGVNERFFHRDGRAGEVLSRHGIEFPYILCVGTLEPRKNLIGTVQAFGKLLDKHAVEYHLVVVGAKGWKYSGLYDLLEQHPKWREHIHFLGYVADEDLPALYQQASLFVYPSYYEGFGLPILEAMAGAVPVITSTASSLPEVIGDAGLMVDPYATDQLANAMHRVLSDPELAERMALSGQLRARAFTWQRTAKQTMDVFEYVMSEAGQHGPLR